MAPDDTEVPNIYAALAASTPRQEARMPREIDAAEAARIRREFKEFMTAHGIPMVRVAQKLETSKPTASSVLSGTYKADDSKYLRQLQQWLADPESYKHLRNPAPLSAAEINCLVDIRSVVEHAIADGVCCVIVGQSGTCKTTFAQSRARERTNCVHVQLTSTKYSNLAMLQRIADEIGLDHEAGRTNSSDRLHSALCKRLSNPPRVLFIDNAHVLNIDNLWSLHGIHDATGSTIVAMGQPRLLDTLNASRNDRGVGATLYSRFAYKLNLQDAITERVNPVDPRGKPYKPNRQYLHTSEDVAKFLKSLAIKAHKGAIDRLVQIANSPNYGGLHIVGHLVRLAWRCYEATGINELSIDHIFQAERLMIPESDHRLLLSEMEKTASISVG